MAEERVQRRLAAILAADVVGYSRLMGEDEAGTLAALKRHRADLIDPKIAEYRGRMVKLMGDGALVEFASVVDAVECAVAIQRAMAEHNVDALDRRKIEFRIGVNLGDIIIDGDDIYGDGVNVAARLEGLAEPGGVCISGTVYEHVKGKLDVTFDDLGSREVKNIAEPVRAYSAQVASMADTRQESQETTEVAPRRDKPSIAVLPFDNMSGDPEQEYFADGMVEEIITGLSRIRWLTVIARNSSFAYKGKSPDIRQVAKELNVRYVLEGSVRRAGDRVRISTQLIEAATAGQLWAERFDGFLADVFDLQDQITAGVVGAIEPSVRKAEIERAKRRPPDDLDAYNLYLQALAHMHEATREGRIAALDLISKVLEIDPNYAEAHGAAAWCYFARSLWEGEVAETFREQAMYHVRAVQRLQTEDASTLAYAAIAMAVATHDYDAALEMIARAIAINPSSVHAHAHGAVINTWAGNYETAIKLAKQSLRLSPFDPLSVMPLAAMAGARLRLNQYEEALAEARRALQIYPTHTPSHLITVVALVRLGRLNEAKAAAARVLDIHPNVRVDKRDQGVAIWFSEELLEAGIPE